MSNRIETEMFFEAFLLAKTVLADKQRLLQDFDGEQINRSELCEARDALQALLQRTQSLHQFCGSLQSDEAEETAAVQVEQLQHKLRDARKQTNRSNRKIKRLKRKLARIEDNYDRLCERITEEERLHEEDCIDLVSHPPYPEIELLSSDEWDETEDIPPDSPHLWKYEGLESE